MELIERISDRWQKGELTKIEIPSGAQDAPLAAYFSPWTLHDQRSIRHFIEDENPKGFGVVVRKKLTDADGKAFFEPGRPVEIRADRSAETNPGCH